MFPGWYANKFRSRWRFATSRLALESTPIGRDVLLSMGTRSPLDARVIAFITKLPLPARFVKLFLLFWLTIRLHPTSLSRLAITSLWRAFERRSWTQDKLSAYAREPDRRALT